MLMQQDNALSDDVLRRFAEECDGLQGFQLSFDNDSFGGFTAAFLESIRDEYPKAPALAFPILSGMEPTAERVGKDADDVSVFV